MNDVNLTDLDELVQQVKDKNSRVYINEAIKSYRAGAYRAAIVAAWITAVYDIIAKLRELRALQPEQKFMLTSWRLRVLVDKKRPNKPSLALNDEIVKKLGEVCDRDFNTKDELWDEIESLFESDDSDTNEIKNKLKQMKEKLKQMKDQILAAGTPISEFLEKVTKHAQDDKINEIEGQSIDEAYRNELLLPYEYEALSLLHQDRHKCAHPAFASETTLFQPSPERTRMHITHVLQYLLCHEPIRGVALKQIKSDLRQVSFSYTETSTFLNSRYFRSIQDKELIRQLTLFLLKALLQEEQEEFQEKEHNLAHTLKVVQQKHSDLYQEVMSDQIEKILKRLEGETRLSVFRVLRVDPRCWYILSESERILIKKIVEEKTGVTDKEDINVSIRLFHKYDVFASINERVFESYISQLFDRLEPLQQEQIILDILQLQPDYKSFQPTKFFLEKARILFLKEQEKAIANTIYNLTEQSLELLKDENISENILEALEAIVNKPMIGKEKFLDTVKEKIIQELTFSDEKLILKHAREKNQRTHVESIGKKIILPLAYHFSAEQIQAILYESLKNYGEDPDILDPLWASDFWVALWKGIRYVDETHSDWQNFITACEYEESEDIL